MWIRTYGKDGSGGQGGDKASPSNKDVKAAINAVMEVIKDGVNDGAEIWLMGFGTLKK